MGNQNPGYISGRPVNFHLPAATKHWLWCQARQHQETHLPSLPTFPPGCPLFAHCLSPRSRAGKTHPANSNDP